MPLPKHLEHQFGMPYRTEFLDVVHGSLYDCCAVASGSRVPSTLMFFQNPIGPERTIQWTNLKMHGRLPTPTVFLVTSIKLVFASSCDETDIAALVDSYLFEFHLGNKWYIQQPLSFFSRSANNTNAPIWICQYCASVHALDQCPGCGARERKLFRALHGEEIGDSLYLDLTEGGEITILDNLIFQAKLSSDYGFTTSPMKSSKGKMTGGLKFWVHLVGWNGRAAQ